MNIPMEEITKVFDAMRKEAVPGDCAVCQAKDVPTVELNAVHDPLQKMRVCVDCLTGKNEAKKFGTN